MKAEPVTLAVLIPLVVWLAAHFGFNVDEDTASAIAGGLLVILGFFARHAVTPVANPHDNEGRPLKPVDTRGRAV
jgi:hypothetical protein